MLPTTWLRRVQEAWLLTLVCLAPWAFGCVHPLFLSLLLSGVSILLALWAVTIFWEGKLAWRWSPVTVCLVVILGWGWLQTWTLPPTWLRWLSPAVGQLADRLLPDETELLANGQSVSSSPAVAGETITVHPYATHRVVVNLVALLLLFEAVRANAVEPGAFRRFSLACCVNGTLLAYLGIAQFLSARPGVLYWSFASQGASFGPFINRNHFATYVNVCVGLGVGLLLARRAAIPASESRGWRRWLALVRDTRALAILLGLTTMVAAVVLCVSRGGVVALLIGGLIALGLHLRHQRRYGGWDVMVLIAFLAALFLVWLGFDLFESRLATAWRPDVVKAEGRLQVWSDTLYAALDFPLFGAGYGTFPYIEPMYRRAAYAADALWEHAHNDYEQALVEGGVVRFIATLLLVGLVFGELWRAYPKYSARGQGGLVLGATIAFSALVVQAFVEFGLQIPAIACLASVLVAHICCFNAPHNSTIVERGRGPRAALVTGSASVCLLASAVWLHAEGKSVDLAERYRLTALRAEQEREFDKQLAALAAAVRITPENPELHVELAAAHFRLAELTGAAQQAEAARRHLLDAQEHYLRARDLCFLIPQPQVWLAANAEGLLRADPPEAYLQRARLLRPFDSQIWYVEGVRALLQEDQARALQSWQRCLELSPQFLPSILRRVQSLDPPPAVDLLIEQLLPDDPQQLFQAAELLYPDREDPARRKLLQQAAESLRRRPLRSEDYQLEILLQRALDDFQQP